MTNDNPLVDGCFIALVLNTLVAMNNQMKIRVLLKTLYPQIAESIGDGSFLGNSIKNSMAFFYLTFRPPSEITYKPLLRLLTLGRVLFAVQLLILASAFLSGILGIKRL
jgi:hypothetical protein